MRPSTAPFLTAVALVALLVGATATLAADREYRIRGTVVDSKQQPIEDTVIEVRERETRRRFRTKTDEEGFYSLVGLPRGIYEVTVSKEGYQSRKGEWDLHERQDRMKTIEYQPYVMVSDAELRERERGAELQGMVSRANELVQGGDIDGALKLLDEVLAERPDEVNAIYLLGFCRLQKDDVEAAETALGRVLELAPDLAAAHVYLGICHERQDDPDGALAFYASALKLDPVNHLALYNAGVLHYNADRFNEARSYFRRAVEVTPDDDYALEMLAYCLVRGEEYAEALQLLERARAATSDADRAATMDEVIESLQPKVTQPEGGGNDA